MCARMCVTFLATQFIVRISFHLFLCFGFCFCFCFKLLFMHIIWPTAAFLWKQRYVLSSVLFGSALFCFVLWDVGKFSPNEISRLNFIIANWLLALSAPPPPLLHAHSRFHFTLSEPPAYELCLQLTGNTRRFDCS